MQFWGCRMEIAIGAVCTLLGTLIAYLTFTRNRDKDTVAKAKEEAIISTQLGSISTGIEEIRVDMKANEKQMDRMQEQIIRIDESTKSAHKRLDKIDEKI